MRVYHSAYHDVTYNPRKLKERIDRVAKALLKLRKNEVSFNAIAFRGSSGASVAYAVSAKTGIPLAYVRKERNHNGDKVEGTDNNVRNYIILDDFISSGDTVRLIAKAMTSKAEDLWYLDQPRCVGIALYNDKSRAGTEWKVQGKFVPIFKV